MYFIFRTREQRISDSGNSTTSSGEGGLEIGTNNSSTSRKRSVTSTTSISSNRCSNGTIIDNVADDDLKSFNLEEVASNGSTGNTEITSIKNGNHNKEERRVSNFSGVDIDSVAYVDDLSYQDKLFSNVRRLSNTVSIDYLSS